MAGQITTPSGAVTRTFFLPPEVFNIPLGLTWPTTISYKDFYSSVHGLNKGYSAFLLVLQALEPQLTTWLAAVQLEPTRFGSLSFPFLHIHPAGFTALGSGASPDSIVDARAFSPLVEMLSGYIWRLTSDSVLATGSPKARLVFLTFLARGETAITPASYFGAAIPGRFCPSFAYHFTVGDHWPTRQDPLEDLLKSPFISE
jgi:hypothetical protein